MSTSADTEGKVSINKRKFPGKKPLVCKMCDEDFSVEMDWLSHISVHTDKKPFLCERCDLAFERKDLYDDHVANHGHTEALFCSACKVVLLNDDNENQNNDAQGKALCPHCFLDQGMKKSLKATGSSFVEKEKKGKSL